MVVELSRNTSPVSITATEGPPVTRMGDKQDPVNRGELCTATARDPNSQGSMKVPFVSDSHGRADMLLAAVTSAKAEGAQAVEHCGDVIGANTLPPLIALGLPVHAVYWNNLGDAAAVLRCMRHPAGS